MSEENTNQTSPTLEDLNNVLSVLKSSIAQLEYPENYSDDVKNKLKNDFFNISVKISNHPKFPEVERYVSVNNVEISFGLQTFDRKYIKMAYTILYIKDGEDISLDFAVYNPPIVGDMTKMMMPRMMDGTPIVHINRYVTQQPKIYDANGNLITDETEIIREDIVKYPMYEVMMPMFNAPISDRDIVIAFVMENDSDGYFNK